MTDFLEEIRDREIEQAWRQNDLYDTFLAKRDLLLKRHFELHPFIKEFDEITRDLKDVRWLLEKIAKSEMSW